MGSKQVRLTVAIAVSIVLVATLAYSQVPWKKYSYWQNWSGLNDNQSATEIKDGEATEIKNVVFDTGGALKKRYGYAPIPADIVQSVATGTTVAPVIGVGFYERNSGARSLVAVCSKDSKGLVMKKDYQTGGGWVQNSWDNIDFFGMPTTTNNTQVDFAVAENKLIFTLENSTPYMWTGTGRSQFLTSSANCPTASIVEYHKRHLFLSGNTTYPSRIYFSELDDITTWSAIDFIDIETSDGSKVRALISVYDSLYIFKDNSIWRLSGYERDTWQLQQMVSGIGTLSNNSVAVVNNLVYFTTEQNDVAVYDGGYNVKFLSTKIRNTIGGLNFTRTQYILGLAYSAYKFGDHDYYCAVSKAGSSTQDEILLFDTSYSAWTVFDGIKPSCWTVADSSKLTKTIVYGTTTGYVFYYPTTNYRDIDIASESTISLGFKEATGAISSIYQTKWFKYDDLCLGDKYWRLLKTYGLSETGSTTLYADCKADYEASGRTITINLQESGALWGYSAWDVDIWSGQTIIVGRDEIEKGKIMFQIRYYNNNVNEGFTLLGYELFIEPTDRI